MFDISPDEKLVLFGATMNALLRLRIRRAILATAALHLACSSAYQYDEISLEEMFLEYHPDCFNVVWEEVANLTAESYERLCCEVVSKALTPVHKVTDYTFVSVPTDGLQADRVIRGAILELQNRLVIITVLKCLYREKQFYLTHANGSHVFELNRERNTITFTLRSGMYQVNYD